MSIKAKVNGNDIKFENNKWTFSNNDKEVSENYKLSECPNCHKNPTQEGHDGCMGTLIGVRTACCGHGNPEDAYVEFYNREIITGETAIVIQNILKKDTQYNGYGRKYLTDIGMKLENIPSGWNKDDKRQQKWKKERDIYGFDERETWALDYTFRIFAYERLMMYNEINIIDTNSVELELGEIKTLQQAIDFVLENYKYAITTQDFEMRESVYVADRVLMDILSMLWW